MRPQAVAVANEALFIAEGCRPAVRRIDLLTGIATTLSVLPHLTGIGQMVADNEGNLIAASAVHNQVLRINTRTGAIEVIAGTGHWGYSGDGGPATKAEFNQPYGLALDATGNIYVGDGANKRVRRIDIKSGVITTVVGCGKPGVGGDGGTATEAGLDWPESLAFDNSENLYIAQNTDDSSLTRVRKVDLKSGLITTFLAAAGTGYSVGADASRNVYIAFGGVIRRLDGATGVPKPVIGCADCDDTLGRLAIQTHFQETAEFTFDDKGNAYVGIFDTHRILRIRAKDGIVEHFAGNGKPDHVHVLL
jgi:streptogramin lyase